MRLKYAMIDGVEPDPDRGPVAADHRSGLGLAIALQQRQPHRLEEQSDVEVERRPARDHRLDPAAEARPHGHARIRGQLRNRARWGEQCARRRDGAGLRVVIAISSIDDAIQVTVARYASSRIRLQM